MNISLAQLAFAKVLAGKAATANSLFQRFRIWNISRELLSVARMHNATRSAHVNLTMQSGGITTLLQAIEVGSELAQLKQESERLTFTQDRNDEHAGRHAGEPEGKVYEQKAAQHNSERARLELRYAELQKFAQAQGYDVPGLLMRLADEIKSPLKSSAKVAV